MASPGGGAGPWRGWRRLGRRSRTLGRRRRLHGMWGHGRRSGRRSGPPGRPWGRHGRRGPCGPRHGAADDAERGPRVGASGVVDGLGRVGDGVAASGDAQSSQRGRDPRGLPVVGHVDAHGPEAVRRVLVEVDGGGGVHAGGLRVRLDRGLDGRRGGYRDQRLGRGRGGGFTHLQSAPRGRRVRRVLGAMGGVVAGGLVRVAAPRLREHGLSVVQPDGRVRRREPLVVHDGGGSRTIRLIDDAGAVAGRRIGGRHRTVGRRDERRRAAV